MHYNWLILTSENLDMYIEIVVGKKTSKGVIFFGLETPAFHVVRL